VTAEQQNQERLAAWDDYCASREKLLALRAKFGRWTRPLGDVYSRVLGHPENACEDDLKSLPTSEEYAAAVREMKQAHSEFLSLYKQAKAFGFPAESDEQLFT
jgi:hypothetical protein